MPYFNKEAIRIQYDEATIQRYLNNKWYRDLDVRRRHLAKSKYATSLLRAPSSKGCGLEKIGHPSQKPAKLILLLVESSSRAGDMILDLSLAAELRQSCEKSLAENGSE